VPAPERNLEDLSPEAILARATAARGDIFPEWKPIAYALPQTYDLINKTGSYLHQYHGQSAEEQALSGPMRELIAIPALCAKGDIRHSANHVRRLYRMGVTNKVLLEAASAFGTVTGWASMTFVSLAIMEANWVENEEWNFVYERVQALQAFFDAIDSLTKAVVRLESLGMSNVVKILGVLK